MKFLSTFSSEKLMTLKDEKISLQSSLLDLGVGGKVAIIRRMLLGIYPKIVIDLKTNSKSLKGLTYFCYSKTFSDKKIQNIHRIGYFAVQSSKYI